MNKEKLAEFLGWHLGDGCISIKNNKYHYSLTGDIKEEYSFYQNTILPSFNNLFQEQFNSKIKIRKYKSVGVCGIYSTNKKFIQFLQKDLKLKAGKKININIPYELINSIKLKKYF